MTAGLKIQPQVLKWAVDASDKTYEEVHHQFENINFNQGSTLTIHQINQLSKLLQVPFGYLILDQPPQEDIELLKYRTIDNLKHEKPSRALIETITTMQKRQEFMKETLIDGGFAPLNFINTISINTPVEEAVRIISNTLNIEKGWNFKAKNVLKKLKSIVSDCGILVMQESIVNGNTRRKLNTDEFRAFVMIDPHVPLIFINGQDSIKGKVFSLCHELVHVFLGSDELYNVTAYESNNKEEQYCNEVAAELLLPKSHLKAKYQNNTQPLAQFINQLAEEYSVSELVVLIRMKKLQLISVDKFELLYTHFQKEIQQNLRKKDKQGMANYYNVKLSNIDSRYIKAVNTKVKEGKLLYADAYDLLGVKGKTYHQLIEKMEGI